MIEDKLNEISDMCRALISLARKERKICEFCFDFTIFEETDMGGSERSKYCEKHSKLLYLCSSCKEEEKIPLGCRPDYQKCDKCKIGFIGTC